MIRRGLTLGLRRLLKTILSAGMQRQESQHRHSAQDSPNVPDPARVVVVHDEASGERTDISMSMSFSSAGVIGSFANR